MKKRSALTKDRRVSEYLTDEDQSTSMVVAAYLAVASKRSASATAARAERWDLALRRIGRSVRQLTRVYE